MAEKPNDPRRTYQLCKIAVPLGKENREINGVDSLTLTCA